ncbi:MAG: hypothetical protein WAK31_27600 [Chthoniobacterales bacterium]
MIRRTMADDKTSKWPDVAKGVTFLTILVFVASLAFVAGACKSLDQNMFGLFDLADYLRIAPAWLIPAFGSYLFMIASHFADYREPVLDPRESEETRQKELSTAVRSNYIWLGALGVIAFVAWIINATHKNNPVVAAISGSFAWITCTLASHRLAFIFLPGYIRYFRLSLEFSIMVPKAVLVCAAAFFWAAFYFDLQTKTAPQRSVTMKDHSVFEGRVIFELSRYLVLENSEDKLIAIQNGEIQTMNFLPKQNTTAGATSPTPSPPPTAASASPLKK